MHVKKNDTIWLNRYGESIWFLIDKIKLPSEVKQPYLDYFEYEIIQVNMCHAMK